MIQNDIFIRGKILIRIVTDCIFPRWLQELTPHRFLGNANLPFPQEEGSDAPPLASGMAWGGHDQLDRAEVMLHGFWSRVGRENSFCLAFLAPLILGRSFLEVNTVLWETQATWRSCVWAQQNPVPAERRLQVWGSSGNSSPEALECLKAG